MIAIYIKEICCMNAVRYAWNAEKEEHVQQ